MGAYRIEGKEVPSAVIMRLKAMRFGGTSMKSEGQACMRALRDQYVFGAGYRVIALKNETVIALGLRSMRKPTLVERYYHAISKESLVSPWTILLGGVRTRF